MSEHSIDEIRELLAKAMSDAPEPQSWTDVEQRARHHDDPPQQRRLGVWLAVAACTVALLGGLVAVVGSEDEPEVPSDDPDSTTTSTSTSTVPSTSVPPTSSPVSTGGAANPLVDMRSLLTNRADSELFVVQSDAESYWRLATLARFDGRTWGWPESELTGADGELAAVRDGAEELRQEVRILGLGGQLIPAAAEPVAASGGNIGWNEDRAMLVSSDGDLAAGAVYDIVSVSPRIALDDLQGASSSNPADPIYLDLPDDLPTSVRTVAQEVTSATTTPYETALTLQDWFQTEFVYSLDVQAGHSNSAMESFLRDRIGYAEQFAGTYAAMMRTLGIPARVAVGFTAGENAGDQGALVLGKHAHAWPEVWFDGLGWVPFEPTPGVGHRAPTTPQTSPFNSLSRAEESVERRNSARVHFVSSRSEKRHCQTFDEVHRDSSSFTGVVESDFRTCDLERVTERGRCRTRAVSVVARWC